MDRRRLFWSNNVGTSAPLAQLRAQLTDAALPGIWTRDGVRLSGAGTVSGIDDARCSTSTGRLLVPRNNGSGVDLGNQAATLDGLSKLTIISRHQPQDVSATAHNFASRYTGSNTGLSPFTHYLNGSNIGFGVWDGAAYQFSALAVNQVVGTDYWFVLVFDGTQAGAARIKFGMTPSAAPNMVTAAGSAVAPPAALPAPTSGVANLIVGAVNGGNSPLVGPLDSVGFYVGQALSDAQINAEIAANLSGAHHRYTFDGTLNDSGTVGGWNGSAIGTGLAYCSDDVRWGGILYSGGGTANPTWDASTREVVFDGVSQYLRAAGLGGSTGVTTSAVLSAIGTEPSATASIQIVADLSNAAVSTSLSTRIAATTGILDANVQGTVAATSAAGRVGTRLMRGRRVVAAGNISLSAARMGTEAEVTAATGAVAADAINRLTVSALRSDLPSNFAAWRLRALIVATVQNDAVLEMYAQSLGAKL